MGHTTNYYHPDFRHAAEKRTPEFGKNDLPSTVSDLRLGASINKTIKQVIRSYASNNDPDKVL